MLDSREDGAGNESDGCVFAEVSSKDADWSHRQGMLKGKGTEGETPSIVG